MNDRQTKIQKKTEREKRKEQRMRDRQTKVQKKTEREDRGTKNER